MANKSVSSDFEYSLQRTSRTVAFVAVVAPLIICVILEFFFTDYFSHGTKRIVFPLILIIAIIFMTRIFLKRTSQARLKYEYATINVVAFIAFNFLLPLPNPYMLMAALLAVLIYFDFGRLWFYVSLALTYGAILVHITFWPFSLVNRLDILAYCLSQMAFAYFVVQLIKLVRAELTAFSKANQRAKSNQRQTESLINNITDGMIGVDQQLEIFVYNAAALDILDVNADIRGKNLSDLLALVDAETQPVDLGELLKKATAQLINRDLRIKYQDGSYANLYIGISPIYLGFGKSSNSGYTLLLRDITREKSLEEERDEFISVVSHELRTPIAIAEGNLGNAQYIANKSGDLEAIKKALNEAHDQVLFLADMINDLSTLSRAERGKLQVEVEAIKVAELIDSLNDSYLPQAKAKGLEVKTTVDTKIGVLNSGKLYVQEILQNFVTNAIKYTNEGHISIEAQQQAKGVKFIISDTGIGISKTDQERVFDKFFRSEDYRTREVNGTGLGLYVTVKLARLIHAEIDLESELNKGSTFTVFVPDLKAD